MRLFRVFAYAVSPQRTSGSGTSPSGGSLTVNNDIRDALDNAFATSKLDSQSVINFGVDTTTRTNDVRDAVLDFAFGRSPRPQNAADTLATRLAESMDYRSSPTLFILAASRDGNRRRVTLWAFPKETAFQFRASRSRPSIKLLTDIFSQTSKLRKAVLFEGKNLGTQFLSGNVFDTQTLGLYGKAATFWIETFLDCQLGLDGETGTKELAKCLRKTFHSTDDAHEREQLSAAMVAVRHSPTSNLSLKQFANKYLSGNVKNDFLVAAPNQETLNTAFNFQREVFDKTLNFRVFGLDTGVYVSAPFDEIGQSVTISDDAERTLSCEGKIVEEKLRSRRA